MNSDIRILQLSNYVRPTLQENKSKDWVLNGKNNSFYLDIIDRKNGSPTNNAIINSYTSLMYGKGLYDLGQSRNATNFLKFKQMISAKEVRKIVADFKLFGEASIQVIKANKKTELPTLLHVPQNKLAPQLEDEDGQINGYWFCNDWTEQNKNKPVYYPAFGTSNESIEIYTIKPYNPGNEYFTDPDWLSGFPYAVMEEEIANLYVNCIKNGLSAGVIVNIPDGNSLTDEQKDTLERKIKAKLTGSNNAGTFVINFKGSDADITVTVLPINDNIHKQWEYLTSEAKQQLLTAHQVTSPMLFGIKDSTGLGNNADELNEAFELLMDSVINPKQLYLTEAFEEIANAYGVVLNLAFKPLRTIVKEEEKTTLSLKKKEDNLDGVADALISLGEEISDEWEIIDVSNAKDTNLKESVLDNIYQFSVRTPDFDKPRKTKSEQDTSLFKVRYKYAGEKTGQREFCNKVLNANKVYRAEDLNKEQTTTPKMGKGGSNKYNPFLYKGGVNCKHFWQRVIYLKKNNNKISVNQARRMILALEPSERKDAMWEQNDKKVAQIADSSNNFWKAN